MEDEFPDLKYKNYQDEFLSDWWSRKKLFRGYRQSGKTTLIISELRRFLNRNMDCLVIAPKQIQADHLNARYVDRFGEQPCCEFETGERLKNGFIRGSRYDVVLVDEIQEIGLESIKYEVEPMDPMFIRACSSFKLDEELIPFFDSEYSV